MKNIHQNLHKGLAAHSYYVSWKAPLTLEPPRQTGHTVFPYPALLLSSHQSSGGISQHSQTNQAKVIIKFVPYHLIWRMNRTLAPTFNMLYHPIAQTDAYTLELSPVMKTVEVVFPPCHLHFYPVAQFINRNMHPPGIHQLTQRLPLVGTGTGLLAMLNTEVRLLPWIIHALLLAKGVSQKIKTGSSLPEITNGGLLLMDRQPHPLFYNILTPGKHSKPNIPRQDNKITHIADYAYLGKPGRTIFGMKSFIQPVQIEIRQQRRNHSSPRRAPVPNHQSPSRRKNVMPPANSVAQRIKPKFRLPLCLDAKLLPQPEARFKLRKKPVHLKSRRQQEVNSFHNGLSRQAALSSRFQNMTTVKPLRYDSQVKGPPRSLIDFSQRAVNHPWEPCRCWRWLLHGMCRLHHFRPAGHSHITYEVKSGSITAHEFIHRAVDRFVTGHSRPVSYISNQQFIL